MTASGMVKQDDFAHIALLLLQRLFEVLEINTFNTGNHLYTEIKITTETTALSVVQDIHHQTHWLHYRVITQIILQSN